MKYIIKAIRLIIAFVVFVVGSSFLFPMGFIVGGCNVVKEMAISSWEEFRR